MPEITTAAEFQFVNSTIHDPTVPRDQAVRALIRKQAMKKAAAARRKDANYGKHNLRQFPVFVVGSNRGDEQPAVEILDTGAPIADVETAILKYECPKQPMRKDPVIREKSGVKPAQFTKQQVWLAKLAMSTNLYASLPAKGYELTSMRSDFDILDLSSLASMFASRATRKALSQDPQSLIHQLRTQKQWSYLTFLPKLYGHYPCLSAAADCVIARARYIISPHENWESAVTSFYVKALGILQKVLDNPEQRYNPEVLCATEILALYELLDPSGESAWIRHSAGAARLIQLRGPENYSTDFEKALFMAHTGPIMTECLLKGERCFLQETAWQDVFRSIIKEEEFLISDRSEITIHLIMMKAFLPGFFHDVTKILCVDSVPDPEFVDTVANGLRRVRANLRRWHCKYTTILGCYPNMLPGSFEYDSHCKVFSTYLSCSMISSRLLSAISQMERADLEDCAQRLADEMSKLDLKTKDASRQTCLFMAQTAGIAGSVKATHAEWRKFSEDESDVYTPDGSALARERLESWCDLFGRTMP
ncbi:hypothetical protein BJ875DRAFT_71660 [Amylocarpus encephaloides]|uniref:Uncharacterized protein n=1 Tax=Amylocarpus encephaloides TaxID=45428 RepID=A0A9P7YFG8_9HELO|nr:hypothetical protein BJ875DRAFT_71660 [Amylocarpus encephaloides]